MNTVKGMLVSRVGTTRVHIGVMGPEFGSMRATVAAMPAGESPATTMVPATAQLVLAFLGPRNQPEGYNSYGA